MIAELSSFLEILCALYASICVDNSLKIGMWKLRISHEDKIYGSNWYKIKEFGIAKFVESCVNDKFNRIYGSFYLIALLMFLSCIALVLLSAFYEKYDYEVGWYILMLLTPLHLIVMWMMFRFDRNITNNIIGACVLAVLMFFYKYIYNLVYNGSFDKCSLQIVIVYAFIQPFLYIFFWRLLIIHACQFIVSPFLKKEFNYLIEIIEARRNDRSVNNELNIPKDYLALLGERYATSAENDGCFESDVLDIFRNRYMEYCRLPGICELLFWYVFSRLFVPKVLGNGV